MTDRIPLDEQIRRFEANWMREVLRLERDLKRPTYLQRLHDLGRERLIGGFDTFGDEMYHWPPELSEQNEMEEVADRIVYGTAHE